MNQDHPIEQIEDDVAFAIQVFEGSKPILREIDRVAELFAKCRHNERCRIALSTPPSDNGQGLREAVGWQPIETAPKDGTVVDLWLGRPTNMWVADPALEATGQRVTNACWLEGAWREYSDWSEDEDDEESGLKWFKEIGYTLPVETPICKVTHWMPLPAPPAALSGSIEGKGGGDA